MLGTPKASKYLHRDARRVVRHASRSERDFELSPDPPQHRDARELRAQVRKFRVETKDPWLINDNYK